MKMTKQQAFRNWNGKEFTRTVKDFISNADKKKILEQLLIDSGFDKSELEDNETHFAHGISTWRKNVVEEVSKVLLDNRSTFITVNDCRAEKTDITILSDTSFETDFALYELI